MDSPKELFIAKLREEAEAEASRANEVVEVALKKEFLTGRLGFASLEHIQEYWEDRPEADFYWSEREKHFSSSLGNGQYGYPYWIEDTWHEVLGETLKKYYLFLAENNVWIGWCA